jgi:hypothetical protein
MERSAIEMQRGIWEGTIVRQKLTNLGAAVLLLASVLPVPVLGQTTDMMVRPMPLPEQLPNRPNRPNDNNNWGGNNQNNWNGAIVRCESRNNRRETCRADTRGGVRLVRQLSSQQCREGRTWGTRSNEIWVDNGCRGDFQLRYGSGQSSGGSGPSAAAIIGGVAVAGGLIALLSQSNSSASPPPAAGTPPAVGNTPTPAPRPPAPPASPARITAQLGGLTPDARPAMQTCLNEAARQVGATGGTEIRLERLDDVQPGNGGFRFRFQLVAVYPDETRSIATFCRATPTNVVELTFG